jgi:hypothetical protein
VVHASGWVIHKPASSSRLRPDKLLLLARLLPLPTKPIDHRELLLLLLLGLLQIQATRLLSLEALLLLVQAPRLDQLLLQQLQLVPAALLSHTLLLRRSHIHVTTDRWDKCSRVHGIWCQHACAGCIHAGCAKLGVHAS